VFFCCSDCSVLEAAWVGGVEDSKVLPSPSLAESPGGRAANSCWSRRWSRNLSDFLKKVLVPRRIFRVFIRLGTWPWAVAVLAIGVIFSSCLSILSPKSPSCSGNCSLTCPSSSKTDQGRLAVYSGCTGELGEGRGADE